MSPIYITAYVAQQQNEIIFDGRKPRGFEAA
jgi:hypothetical protein